MTEKEPSAGESGKATGNGASAKAGRSVLEDFGDRVGGFASKTLESVKKTIDRALSSRNTVLTIRVNDIANERLTMLVDSGLFKSRSESAAFLIDEGIKHQDVLFKKITKKMDQINKLKDELKGIIGEEISGDIINQ